MLLMVLVLFLCPLCQCQTEDAEVSQDEDLENDVIYDMDLNTVGHTLYRKKSFWLLLIARIYNDLIFVSRLLVESRGRWERH